ncbi:MAG: hypothetical protein JJU29_22000 [Verrucomicrobia bacterium]|nr:hypothetical protein [Verrucomicrobiota bacterium]
MPEASPSAVEPPPPAPTHRRATWKFNLVVALISILTPIGIVAALILAPIWDGPPPDDEDMFWERELVPKDENGFELLLAAFALLDADNLNTPLWFTAPDEHREDIQRKLAANEAFFEALETALAKGRLQSPPLDFAYPEDYSLYYSESMGSALLLRLAAQEAANPMEAQKYVMMGYELGNQLLRNSFMLTEVLGRIANCSIANQSVLHQARNPETPTEHLWHFLSMLTENPISKRTWKNAIRMEYQALDYLLTNFRQEAENWLMEDMGAWYKTISFSYQPNNTRRIALMSYRNAIQTLETGNLEFQINSDRFASDLWKEISSRQKWDPRRYHNITGKKTIMALLPGLDGFVNQAFRQQAENRATILVTALQLHLREQGELPQSLQDLVPAYLAEIPEDPYDGQPFRYDRDKAIVYAIGENLVDNGGSTKMRGSPRTPSRSGAEDFVFGILAPIDFTAGD